MNASVFILSYPSVSSSAPGSASGAAGLRQALTQWLALADHITRAGGTILLLDPPADAPATDLVATSRLGSVFVGARSDGSVDALFLRAQHDASGPSAGVDPISAQLRSFGLRVRDATVRWGGQAELVGLPRNRFIVSYGARSTETSADEVAACLPLGAHTLRVQVAGDSGLAAFTYLQSVGGNSVLLIDQRVMPSVTLAQVAAFAGDKVQVIGVAADDAAAGATQLLCVHGTVLAPPGISTTLRGHLWRTGFQVAEVDLSALGGPSVGIGPRAFVIAWPQCLLDDTLPTYATRRADLYRRLESLPAV